ncbi:MAG: hypothetical protein ACLUFL_07835, partial [Flavonifractor plautii]
SMHVFRFLSTCLIHRNVPWGKTPHGTSACLPFGYCTAFSAAAVPAAVVAATATTAATAPAPAAAAATEQDNDQNDPQAAAAAKATAIIAPHMKYLLV